MNGEQTEQFLRKIVTDPDYRAQVEQDPIAALAELGITLDPSEIPTGPVRLPPNEQIEAHLAGQWAKLKHPLCEGPIHILAILDWQRH